MTEILLSIIFLFIITLIITSFTITNTFLLLAKILKLLLKFFTFSIYNLNNIVNKFIQSHETSFLEILSVEYNNSGKFITYMVNNSFNESHTNAIKSLFNTLKKNQDFKKLGYYKVIMTSALINGYEHSFHHNILINNDTTFEDYYSQVKDSKIITNYEDRYPIDVIPIFIIRVWNMDNIYNKHIKITRKSDNSINFNVQSRSYSTHSTRYDKLIHKYHPRNLIKPISKTNLIGEVAELFSTMDIETITINNLQVTAAISIVNFDSENKLFLLDSNLPIEKAVENLWIDFFKFIESNPRWTKTIFVHNLGSFDGYFIYKYLSKYADPNQVSTIIDHHNKFITITYRVNKDKSITWKDSYRIFSISLNELCKNFEVEGKLSGYNTEFNRINLFKNESLLNKFKEYCLQDSIALYKALLHAQDIYLKQYKIDITSIVSTASLSLKILRANFLKIEIPVLKNLDDNFIRDSYFGGATDYYQLYGKDLYYYDVVSLYPHAMCKPMPLEIKKRHDEMSNVNLQGFFGFAVAEITTPDTLKPLAPYRYQGRTIYPTGIFIGTYFSEELKALKSRGYKIKLIKGIEFTSFLLFNEYVDHFFSTKKISTGSRRFISKMHLNQLYGIFGRRKDSLTTINVYNKDLPYILATKIVKTIININDEISAVLIHSNLPVNIIKNLNIIMESNYNDVAIDVKNNVAIASAVTSYARIHMMEFKEKYDILYTDTDSLISRDKLPDNLVGNELGLMKDELNGVLIKEAYILDIKKYGYWYIDKNNKRIEKSVIAGIDRDSISFAQFKELSQGKSFTIKQPIRFYKSIKSFNIEIKPCTVTIKKTNIKTLKGNHYIPIHINKPFKTSLLSNLLNRILKNLKTLIKKLT